MRRLKYSKKKAGGREWPSRFFIPTSYGAFELLISGKGVESVSFPRRKAAINPRQAECKMHGKSFFPALPDLTNALQNYFEGKPVSFKKIPINFEPYGGFVKKVLLACRKIPYGKTVSYGKLAKRIKHPRAARAVGTALGMNRTPVLIPCHRVISGNRGLGGFSSGTRWKTLLLSVESDRKQFPKSFP